MLDRATLDARSPRCLEYPGRGIAGARAASRRAHGRRPRRRWPRGALGPGRLAARPPRRRGRRSATRALFDLNPVCTLHVGYHVFGDTYPRGAFLVNLAARAARRRRRPRRRLPDHLPTVLRLLGALGGRGGAAATIVWPRDEPVLARRLERRWPSAARRARRRPWRRPRHRAALPALPAPSSGRPALGADTGPSCRRGRLRTAGRAHAQRRCSSARCPTWRWCCSSSSRSSATAATRSRSRACRRSSSRAGGSSGARCRSTSASSRSSSATCSASCSRAS